MANARAVSKVVATAIVKAFAQALGPNAEATAVASAVVSATAIAEAAASAASSAQSSGGQATASQFVSSNPFPMRLATLLLCRLLPKPSLKFLFLDLPKPLLLSTEIQPSPKRTPRRISSCRLAGSQ